MANFSLNMADMERLLEETRAERANNETDPASSSGELLQDSTTSRDETPDLRNVEIMQRIMEAKSASPRLIGSREEIIGMLDSDTEDKIFTPVKSLRFDTADSADRPKSRTSRSVSSTPNGKSCLNHGDDVSYLTDDLHADHHSPIFDRPDMSRGEDIPRRSPIMDGAETDDPRMRYGTGPLQTGTNPSWAATSGDGAETVDPGMRYGPLQTGSNLAWDSTSGDGAEADDSHFRYSIGYLPSRNNPTWSSLSGDGAETEDPGSRYANGPLSGNYPASSGDGSHSYPDERSSVIPQRKPAIGDDDAVSACMMSSRDYPAYGMSAMNNQPDGYAGVDEEQAYNNRMQNTNSDQQIPVDRTGNPAHSDVNNYRYPNDENYNNTAPAKHSPEDFSQSVRLYRSKPYNSRNPNEFETPSLNEVEHSSQMTLSHQDQFADSLQGSVRTTGSKADFTASTSQSFSGSRQFDSMHSQNSSNNILQESAMSARRRQFADAMRDGESAIEQLRDADVEPQGTPSELSPGEYTFYEYDGSKSHSADSTSGTQSRNSDASHPQRSPVKPSIVPQNGAIQQPTGQQYQRQFSPNGQSSPTSQRNAYQRPASSQQHSPNQRGSPNQQLRPNQQPNPYHRPNPNQQHSPEQQPNPYQRPNSNQQNSPSHPQNSYQRPRSNEQISPSQQQNPYQRPNSNQQISPYQQQISLDQQRSLSLQQNSYERPNSNQQPSPNQAAHPYQPHISQHQVQPYQQHNQRAVTAASAQSAPHQHISPSPPRVQFKQISPHQSRKEDISPDVPANPYLRPCDMHLYDGVTEQQSQLQTSRQSQSVHMDNSQAQRSGFEQSARQFKDSMQRLVQNDLARSKPVDEEDGAIHSGPEVQQQHSTLEKSALIPGSSTHSAFQKHDFSLPHDGHEPQFTSTNKHEKPRQHFPPDEELLKFMASTNRGLTQDHFQPGQEQQFASTTKDGLTASRKHYHNEPPHFASTIRHVSQEQSDSIHMQESKLGTASQNFISEREPQSVNAPKQCVPPHDGESHQIQFASAARLEQSHPHDNDQLTMKSLHASRSDSMHRSRGAENQGDGSYGDLPQPSTISKHGSSRHDHSTNQEQQAMSRHEHSSNHEQQLSRSARHGLSQHEHSTTQEQQLSRSAKHELSQHGQSTSQEQQLTSMRKSLHASRSDSLMGKQGTDNQGDGRFTESQFANTGKPKLSQHELATHHEPQFAHTMHSLRASKSDILHDRRAGNEGDGRYDEPMLYQSLAVTKRNQELEASIIPGLDVEEMQKVRQHIHSMLKMSDHALQGIPDEFDHSTQVSTASELLASDMDHPWQGAQSIGGMSKMLPSSAPNLWAGKSVRPAANPALVSENRLLKETLEQEMYRRKHCEEHIQHLNTKLLEVQQQLAVAVSTDRKKDSMIEQLDKQLARVVDGWKKRESEKDEYIAVLKSEKDKIADSLKRHEEMLSKFERELSSALEELKKERESSKQKRELLQQQLEEQNGEYDTLTELLESERSRSQLLEVEWEKSKEVTEELDKRLTQLQENHAKDYELWHKKEEEMMGTIEELSATNVLILEEEKIKLEELRSHEEQLLQQLKTAQNEGSKLQMDLDAACRERESLKVEMSLSEAKYESNMRKLEAQLKSESEKLLSEKISKLNEKAEISEVSLNESHRSHIKELTEQHANELQHHLDQFQVL